MIFEQHYLECLSQASYLIGDPTTRTGRRRRPSPRHLGVPRVGRRARPDDRARHRDPLPRRLPLRSPRAGGGDRGDDRLRLGRRDRVRVAQARRRRAHRARRGRAGGPPHTGAHAGVDQRRRVRARRPTPSRSPCSPATRCSSATSAGPTCCRRRASPARSSAGLLTTRCTSKLLTLPDGTRVYPAHGAGSACGKNLSTDTWSTIGEQRRDQLRRCSR